MFCCSLTGIRAGVFSPVKTRPMSSYRCCHSKAERGAGQTMQSCLWQFKLENKDGKNNVQSVSSYQHMSCLNRFSQWRWKLLRSWNKELDCISLSITSEKNNSKSLYDTTKLLRNQTKGKNKELPSAFDPHIALVSLHGKDYRLCP